MDSEICILTDRTVQFPARSFEGQEIVQVMPIHVYRDGMEMDSDSLRAGMFPPSLRTKSRPEIITPSVQDFQQTFTSLGSRYEHIIVLLSAAALCDSIVHAREAAESQGYSASIEVIDSQTTSAGLGFLVQNAAEAIAAGGDIKAVRREIRGNLPKVYSIFCLTGLTYLERLGIINPSQAVIGEMVKMIPFFVLSHGVMIPTQKIKKPRHLVDAVCEFADEFSELKHVALLNGFPPFDTETRMLRDRLQLMFEDISISDHAINAPLASLIGPRSLGVFLWEQGE
jgi:DegV family protein with EDD domain